MKVTGTLICAQFRERSARTSSAHACSSSDTRLGATLPDGLIRDSSMRRTWTRPLLPPSPSHAARVGETSKSTLNREQESLYRKGHKEICSLYLITPHRR